HQIKAGQIRAHQFLELGAGEQHQPVWSLQQDERHALGQADPFPQLGRNDQPPAVSHRYLIRPTHDPIIPLYSLLWYAEVIVPRANECGPGVPGNNTRFTSMAPWGGARARRMVRPPPATAPTASTAQVIAAACAETRRNPPAASCG